jgi:hypothetical protein
MNTNEYRLKYTAAPIIEIVKTKLVAAKHIHEAIHIFDHETYGLYEIISIELC